MKFVKVPGTKVLFCIHETRKKDFTAFTVATPDFSTTGISIRGEEEEPVRAVSWDDAKAFCCWLGQKEGRVYRLPTDREWSTAVGLGRNEDKEEFPWGRRWPPPEGAGNFADTTFNARNPKRPFIEGYTDGYTDPAPVMSFQPNKLGVYDLAGNLNEWCEDLRPDGKARVMRGSSAGEANPFNLLSFVRNGFQQDSRNNAWVGFRIVLETTE